MKQILLLTLIFKAFCSNRDHLYDRQNQAKEDSKSVTVIMDPNWQELKFNSEIMEDCQPTRLEANDEFVSVLGMTKDGLLCMGFAWPQMKKQWTFATKAIFGREACSTLKVTNLNNRPTKMVSFMDKDNKFRILVLENADSRPGV